MPAPAAVAGALGMSLKDLLVSLGMQGMANTKLGLQPHGSLAQQQAQTELAQATAAVETSLGELKDAATLSAKALLKLPFTLKSLSLAKVKQLSEFGPQLSFAQAQLELGDLRRQIQMANYLGPSGSRLAGAENRLQNSLLPWKAIGYEIGTRVAESLTNSLNSVAANPQRLGWLAAPFGALPGMIGKRVGDSVKKAMEDLKKSNAAGMPVFNWAHRLGEQRDQADAARRRGQL